MVSHNTSFVGRVYSHAVFLARQSNGVRVHTPYEMCYDSITMNRRNIILFAIAIIVVVGIVVFIFWPDPAPIKMVRINPGTFVMGSPKSEPGRYDDEVQHTVKITKAFYMGLTPITQAQWNAVMGNNPSKSKGDDLPVENLSWNDAVAFCQKLSAREHKKYRLPTEAEWEYACRAGTTTEYYTGNGTTALDKAGWYVGNSTFIPVESMFFPNTTTTGAGTHPVAQKVPNAWGLYDMHGNVCQWCSDFAYDYTGDAENPTGPATGNFRVLRGGSWDSGPQFSRSAYRNYAAPVFRGLDCGLRIALDSN